MTLLVDLDLDLAIDPLRLNNIALRLRDVIFLACIKVQGVIFNKIF